MVSLILALIAIHSSVATRPATGPAGPLARLTIIRPKPDMTRDFEEGYKRHLAWHRGNDDPWTWHGWTVVTGDRFGTFVDASFGHDAEELASPVRPAEDAADNRLNTLPYVESLEAFILIQRSDFGGSTIDFAKYPFVQVFEYDVELPRYDDWSRAIRDIEVDHPFSWFEFVNGGAHPRFLLLLPARSMADANLAPIDVLPDTLRKQVSSDDIDILRRSVRGVRSELLRHRPELTYIPE